MVDERTYILKDHVQLGVVLVGGTPALEKVRNKTLLIHYVLANEHCILLQLVDIQEEILVDIFLLVDALAEL